MFEKYFFAPVATILAKRLFKIKNKKENNDLVKLIKSGIIDSEEEIKNMSKEEIELEKPDKILTIVKEILKFNREKQSGHGLKILTPDQMLSRLPITLVELKSRK